MPEENIEIVVLHGGPVAGIPDSHVGAGTYCINWTLRTITPIIPGEEEGATPIEESGPDGLPASGVGTTVLSTAPAIPITLEEAATKTEDSAL